MLRREQMMASQDVVRPRLRAIVALDYDQRIRCQQPGCGHSVHAAVHVVQEGSHHMALGSTCFAKRYGGLMALGGAQYGGGGGRRLTPDERQLLLENTDALLARFEQEERARAAAEAHAAAQARNTQRAVAQELEWRRLEFDRLSGRQAAWVPTPVVGASKTLESPWPWQSKRNSSVALFTAPDGAHWVRVQHEDGSQKLVPWPAYPGWEEALPPGVGVPDPAVQGYAVGDIAAAIERLRRHGFAAPRIGRWRDVRPRRSA